MANEIVQVQFDSVIIDADSSWVHQLGENAKSLYRAEFPQTPEWVKVMSGKNHDGSAFTISCRYAPSQFEIIAMYERYT
jgi:hypothetical protein